MTDRPAIDRSPAPRTMFGISFSRDSMEEMLADIVRGPDSGQGARLTVTANVDHIVLLRKNAALRSAYAHAWRRTIDGFPVFLYSRLRGLGVPERVTGADLFPRLLARLVPGKHRLFLVVANDEISRLMIAWAQENGFGDSIDIAVPPFGFERDAAFGDALAARIAGHRTTHLVFGVGCPRSEAWIDTHRDRLGDCYAFAVGAAVGFFVGTVRRAPPFMRKVGLEWAWRVMEEPRRLARRYLVSSWAFCLAVKDDLSSQIR